MIDKCCYRIIFFLILYEYCCSANIFTLTANVNKPNCFILWKCDWSYFDAARFYLSTSSCESVLYLQLKQCSNILLNQYVTVAPPATGHLDLFPYDVFGRRWFIPHKLPSFETINQTSISLVPNSHHPWADVNLVLPLCFSFLPFLLSICQGRSSFLHIFPSPPLILT